MITLPSVINQTITESYAAYNTDCVEGVRGLPDNCVHFGIHSPPFSNLYIYGDSVRDMGNCADDEEFLTSYGFLVKELYRTTIPGRLCAVHCKQLVNYKGRDGRAGLRDFRGDIIRLFESCGWQYHSEVCIWKDPVIEMQRTKAHGLLHKQLCQDSSFSRQGMAEYLVVFRKWAEEGDSSLIEPVHGPSEKVRFETDSYVGEFGPDPSETFNRKDPERQYSIGVWQRYASPVWMDIRQTDVLNVKAARESEDEKHIAPLQLDVIERAIHLWTNAGDIVLSPFMGIGSEGYVSLKMKRRFIGFELKPSYYQQALENLREIEEQQRQPTLFGDWEAA